MKLPIITAFSLMLAAVGVCAEPKSRVESRIQATDLRFLHKEDLVTLYEQAIRDFAQEEVARNAGRKTPRRFRLRQNSDSLDILGDRSQSWILLAEGDFCSVDFETALKDGLVNSDSESKERYLNLSLAGIRYSSEPARIQVTLQWSHTISESYTYLYSIGKDRQLKLIGSRVLGCSGPNGMISPKSEHGADQPATAPESKPESEVKPKPESEGRSQ